MGILKACAHRVEVVQEKWKISGKQMDFVCSMAEVEHDDKMVTLCSQEAEAFLAHFISRIRTQRQIQKNINERLGVKFKKDIYGSRGAWRTIVLLIEINLHLDLMKNGISPGNTYVVVYRSFSLIHPCHNRDVEKLKQRYKDWFSIQKSMTRVGDYFEKPDNIDIALKTK